MIAPAVLLAALAASGLPAQASPCAGAPALPIASAAAPEGGFWILPPCAQVPFTAHDVAGRPPITLTWTADTGQLYTGNSITLDTTPYTGFHRLTLRATNPWGTATRDLFFQIPTLAAPTPTATSQNPTPALSIAVAAAPAGATAWRLTWGDGSATPWSSTCPAQGTHTYATAGTFAVRLEARTCTSTQTSPPLTVTVGDPSAFTITAFQVQGCAFGTCLFDVGDLLTFDQTFSAPPDRFDYDWNGDGTVDQTSTTPVLTHAYSVLGAFRPVLTARRGTATASRQHADFILILDGGGEDIFSDGFETGTTGRWSKTVHPVGISSR